MLKRFISSALALTLVLGSAAVLPEGSAVLDTAISASAADTAPAQVKGVKASGVSYKTATLTWNKVKGAKGYRIYVYDTAAKNYKKVTTISKNTTSYKLTGLQQGKTYKYKVRAYKKIDGKNVWGKSSSAVSFSTKKEIKCSDFGWVYNVPNDGRKAYDKLDKVAVVTNEKELNALIKYINKNYPDDVKTSDMSPVYILKTADANFFKNYALIYTLSITEGIDAQYTTVNSVKLYSQKKGGKLTAYVNATYKEQVPDDVAVNDEYYSRFNCYIVAVKKSDIKNIKVFKLTDKKVN